MNGKRVALLTRCVLTLAAWMGALRSSPAHAQRVRRAGDSEVRAELERPVPGSGALRALADGRWVGPHALVRLAPRIASDWFGRHGLRTPELIHARLGIWRVRGEAGEDGESLARRLRVLAGVRQVTADYYVRRRPTAIDIPPNDPRYGGQWYLDRIDVEAAWAISTGDPDTLIAIVDNGCDMTHPDLAPSMVGGYDARDDDDDPTYLPGQPGNEHGTACAGIAAAPGDNGIGVAGVCPECSLACVRLLGERGELTPLSADIAAFSYAFDIGAAVVSNSWGFVDPVHVPPMLRAVLEDLHDNAREGRGALVVFAAGNDNRELGDLELTGVRGVVTVGALNLFDEAAPFSNFGATLDLTAPTGTFTTDIQGPEGENETDYTSLFGGTSSACPVVAGVAGLMFSARPDATAGEVHDALLGSVRRAPFASSMSGHDPVYGHGVVDPAPALRRILGQPEDGGVSDAGLDGGGADGGLDGAESGCGCRTAGRAPGGGGWLAAAALVWAQSRRRKGAPCRRRKGARRRKGVQCR